MYFFKNGAAGILAGLVLISIGVANIVIGSLVAIIVCSALILIGAYFLYYAFKQYKKGLKDYK